MQVITFQSTGMFPGLTRPEVVQLMDLTVNQLNHFEKMGWVIPKRFGTNKRRQIIFEFKNLVQLQFIKTYRSEYDKQTVEKVLKFINENTLNLNAWIFVNKDDIGKDEMVGWLHQNDLDLKIDVSIVKDKENIQNIRVNLSFIPPLKILVKKVFEGVESSGAMPLEEFKQRIGVDIRAA
jgi:DNA-binding transcriptional MerR regulator